MSVEDRLYALVSQARQQHGDAFLRNSAQLVPLLSSQAPDLHAEIRALGSALASNAGAGIGVAADPGAEAERLSTEIAGREKLSIAVARSAIEVAKRVGALSDAAPAAAAGGWAGDSVAVGGAGPAATPPYQPPPYQPAPGYAPPPAAGAEKPPIWKNKWVMGGAAAVVALMVFQSMQRPQQPPQPPPQPPVSPQQPPNMPVTPTDPNAPVAPNNPMNPNAPVSPNQPVTPSQPGADQAAGPLLQPPSGNLPTLQVQRAQNGFGIAFSMQIQGGVSRGIVMLPAQGWQAGPTMVGFMRPGAPGAQQPDSFGQGMLQLSNSQMGLMRSMRPQWQQDNVGFGAICIAFIGQQGGQEVSLQGSTMCVMDANCQQAAACGRIQ